MDRTAHYKAAERLLGGTPEDIAQAHVHALLATTATDVAHQAQDKPAVGTGLGGVPLTEAQRQGSAVRTTVGE